MKTIAAKAIDVEICQPCHVITISPGRSATQAAPSAISVAITRKPAIRIIAALLQRASRAQHRADASPRHRLRRRRDAAAIQSAASAFAGAGSCAVSSSAAARSPRARRVSIRATTAPAPVPATSPTGRISTSRLAFDISRDKYPLSSFGSCASFCASAEKRFRNSAIVGNPVDADGSSGASDEPASPSIERTTLSSLVNGPPFPIASCNPPSATTSAALATAGREAACFTCASIALSFSASAALAASEAFCVSLKAVSRLSRRDFSTGKSRAFISAPRSPICF